MAANRPASMFRSTTDSLMASSAILRSGVACAQNNTAP